MLSKQKPYNGLHPTKILVDIQGLDNFLLIISGLAKGILNPDRIFCIPVMAPAVAKC